MMLEDPGRIELEDRLDAAGRARLFEVGNSPPPESFIRALAVRRREHLLFCGVSLAASLTLVVAVGWSSIVMLRPSPAIKPEKGRIDAVTPLDVHRPIESLAPADAGGGDASTRAGDSRNESKSKTLSSQ